MKKILGLLLFPLLFGVVFAAQFKQEREVYPGAKENIFYKFMDVGDVLIFVAKTTEYKAEFDIPGASGWAVSVVGEVIVDDYSKLSLLCGDQISYWHKRLETDFATDLFPEKVTGRVGDKCNSVTTSGNATNTNTSFEYNLKFAEVSIIPGESEVFKGNFVFLSALNWATEHPLSFPGTWSISPSSATADIYDQNSIGASPIGANVRNTGYFMSTTPGDYVVTVENNGTTGVASIKVLDDLSISGELWWNGYDRDGSTNLAVMNYPFSVTIDATGVSGGNIQWDVLAGMNQVDLSVDETFSSRSDSVSTSSSKVYVISTGASSSGNSVKIRALQTGAVVGEIEFNVYSPVKLNLLNNNKVIQSDLVSIGGAKGWNTKIVYALLDNFNRTVPNYPVGEYFTPVSWNNAPGVTTTRWVTGVRNGTYTDSQGAFPDNISMIGSPSFVDPEPLNNQSPLGTFLIQTIGQEIRAGKKSTDPLDNSTGIRLQTAVLHRYQDHGAIIINGKKYE